MDSYRKKIPLLLALLVAVWAVQFPLILIVNNARVLPAGTWLVLGVWSLAACTVLAWGIQRYQSTTNHAILEHNARLMNEWQSLKSSDARLTIERQRFSTIFYKSPVPIAISTMDDEVIDINQAGLTLLGLTREQYMQTGVLKLGSWDMIPERERTMSQFNEYGVVRNVEMPIHRNDGRTVNTLAFFESIVLDNQPCKLVFVLDINDYRHTQERLMQFRRDLHAIARAFSDLYFRMDPSGKLIDYMSGTVPALGLAPEVFLGKTITEVLPADVAAMIMDGINSLDEHNSNHVHTVEYELKLNRKRQHFEVRMVMEDDHNILAIARDITERKEQALRLAESEELFRQLTININEVLFIRDLDQQKLVYISDLLFNVWGEEDEKIIMNSSSLTKDVHPDDLAAVTDLIERQKHGDAADIEYRIINSKTREVRWLRTRNVPIKDSSGNVYRVAVLSEDVTARKISEETLRQNENKFRTLAETMPAGVSIIRKDEVLFINSELERLTGYTSDELESMNYLQLINRDDFAATADWISSRLAEVDPEKSPQQPPAVQRIIMKDGTERWIQFASNKIDMEDGPALLVVGLDVTATQLASETLRQREEEFRAFVENSPDQIARFDRNLRHLYVNPTIVARSRIPAEDYIGKTTREMAQTHKLFERIEDYEDKVDLWEAIMWKVLDTGEEETVEDIYNSANGTFYFETRFVPEFGKNGQVESLLAISRDITESKRAEIERRESELMLRQFAENMHEILVVRDATTQKAIYISPAFEKIWGLPPAPLMDDAFAYKDYILDDGIDYVRQRTYQHETDITYRIRRPDGELRWLRSRSFPIFNEKGEVYRAGGLVEDFTERKQAEDAHRESQVIFDQMANNISEVLFVTESATSQVIYITPSCVDLWGLTPEEIMADSYRLVNAIHPEDLPQMIEKYSTRTHGYSAEYRIIRTDGAVRWVRSRVFPIKNAQGEVYRITGMVEDITERVRMEDDARERERLALELEKQKSFNRIISNFVAMVSHEFRTPLAVILSSGRMLETYAGRMAEERRAHHLTKIIDQTVYMTQLMDEVLTYQGIESRKSEFNPQPLDLVSYAQELVEESHLDRDNPRIRFTHSGDLNAVEMDKKLLRQIINNLLSNAQKYSDDAPVEFNVERRKNLVILEIKDHGIGIPEMYHAYLFEPFRRAENVGTRRGTGLGLAIVKMSVETHKGHINFYTEMGVGTTFTVQLPAIPPVFTPEIESIEEFTNLNEASNRLS